VNILPSSCRIFQFGSNVATTRQVQDLKASLLRFQTIEGIQTDRNFEQQSKALCPIFFNPEFASTEFGMIIDPGQSGNSSEDRDKITETHNLQPLTVL
jgi:hypothetical protein